tara:strand:- start:345 stop:1406 length:1062 start_codon:yes stop_codon:yes gene_type:complete
MNAKLLKNSFTEFCVKNKFEKNKSQLKIIDQLSNFLLKNKNFLNFLFKPEKKACFYLYGEVGSGKTMLMNFFFNQLKTPKYRVHFNEFMIKFHDFRHENKSNNSVKNFVKSLKKKYSVIYLDEFQVTNIVDAMILGKLFENIFKEDIKVLITTNTKVDDLYLDGLQRDQFLPFISLIKTKSIQKELNTGADYRKLLSNNLQRSFYPLNEKTSFKINQIFRKLTRDKNLKEIKIEVKGREFKISHFYDGIVKFDFIDLCEVNLGAEDYIKIAKICKFIVIKNIPNFSNVNINQQQRFITLIDILYENEVFLMISSSSKIENIESSTSLADPFKRTISRLYELTSPKKDFFSKVV